jgi:seryl-tRNA synthetase
MAEEQLPQEPMPEGGAEKIESAEIGEMKERIEKLDSQLKEQAPEKKEEMVKKEIKSYLKELQQMPSSSLPIAARDGADEISKFPANQQVGALIALVFEKGLSEAVSVARALDNPAVLDEFHDLLVDRYYEELVKNKILKNL